MSDWKPFNGEHNVFWNTYAQECFFRKVYLKRLPSDVVTACKSLHEKYPEIEDAEEFIRSQFVVPITGASYSINSVVLKFSHFNNSKHDNAYVQYLNERDIRTDMLITSAINRANDGRSRLGDNALAHFILDGKDCEEEYQTEVALHCLHFPALRDSLILSDFVKAEMLRLRREVRQDEYIGKKLVRTHEVEELYESE